MDKFQRRRLIAALSSLIIFVFVISVNTPISFESENNPIVSTAINSTSDYAVEALGTLAIKGRAPRTNYSRDQFGGDWATTNGCDTRNIILNRDLNDVVVNESCQVISGTLNDPYTGEIIQFQRGSETSSAIQIDHVVALSDAWQKGAQQLTLEERTTLANDPLELLAVDGGANQNKSGGDAATWLPPNKPFRCQYIARQIAVKQKYRLWVTQAEHDAMVTILNKCPGQLLPNP